MYFFFLDDSQQKKPTRHRMGPLVAIGGICAYSEKLNELESGIAKLCAKYEFPSREIFKWSPGTDLWMRKGLTDARREAFYKALFREITLLGCKAFVVIVDKESRPATDADTPELDAVNMAFERVQNHLKTIGSDGIVIISRPGGNRGDEDKFLANCIETIQRGTKYVSMKNVALVLSSPSKFSRLLQVADIVVSCTVARLAGETPHSPFVFDMIKPILVSDYDGIGGVGLKIHPDLKYANLYHWLLGDKLIMKRTSGRKLPIDTLPYAKSPDIF